MVGGFRKNRVGKDSLARMLIALNEGICSPKTCKCITCRSLGLGCAVWEDNAKSGEDSFLGHATGSSACQMERPSSECWAQSHQNPVKPCEASIDEPRVWCGVTDEK